METRVERGQVKEDRITGAIERRTSMAPSSLFLGLALGSMAFQPYLKFRARILGAVRGPVGGPVPHHGKLQQDGEAARIGCDETSPQQHSTPNTRSRIPQSFTHAN